MTLATPMLLTLPKHTLHTAVPHDEPVRGEHVPGDALMHSSHSPAHKWLQHMPNIAIGVLGSRQQ